MSTFENIKGIKGVKNHDTERMTLKMCYNNAIMFNHIVKMLLQVSKLKKEVLADPVSF